MNFRLSAAAAAAGGLLYASPFFPHGAEWVSQIAAFIGLAGLLFSIREETSWKKASLLGFIFGLLAFTPGLSWLYQSLRRASGAAVRRRAAPDGSREFHLHCPGGRGRVQSPPRPSPRCGGFPRFLRVF